MIDPADLRNTAIDGATLERRRGRPGLSREGSEPVSVRLPRPLYDALCRQAFRRGVSLRDVIRRALMREFRT